MINNKPFILCVVFVVAASGLVYSQDAASIVDKSRNRIQAATVSTRSLMVITGKDGKTSERRLDQYSKDDAGGNNRTVVAFLEPASVAGTRFLTIENTGKDDDRWIYLPELKKVRRLAASEGSGSFMGTDLSYDDVSSMDRKADLDNHRLLREEKLNGADCYVIESTPKDSSYQYSKMVLYIDKSTYVNYQVELYDKRGTHVKTMEVVTLADVQGRLTPMVTKLSTLGAGTSTTINVQMIQYDSNVPESVFTTAYLETGRPR
jgi:outer membrane lipoprotein-sorting protein